MHAQSIRVKHAHSGEQDSDPNGSTLSALHYGMKPIVARHFSLHATHVAQRPG